MWILMLSPSLMSDNTLHTLYRSVGHIWIHEPNPISLFTPGIFSFWLSS